jgi:chromosome segregation ATPase
MSYPLPLPIVYGGILRLVLLIGAVSALSGCKRQAQELNLQTIAARQELGSLREELQRVNNEVDDLTKMIGPRAAELKVRTAIKDSEEVVARLQRTATGLKAEAVPLEEEVARLEKEAEDYRAKYIK